MKIHQALPDLSAWWREQGKLEREKRRTLGRDAVDLLVGRKCKRCGKDLPENKHRVFCGVYCRNMWFNEHRPSNL